MGVWNSLSYCVLSLFLLINMSSCSSSLKQEYTNKNIYSGEQERTNTISPSQKDGKILGSPIRTKILYNEADLSDRSNIVITILLESYSYVKNVKVKIETDDGIKLNCQSEYEFKEILRNQQKEVQIRISTIKSGTSELRAIVSGYDIADKKLIDTISSLNFHISEEEVLAGDNGIMELQLKHLDHLKEQGKITKYKYDQERKKILHGGAKVETSIIKDGVIIEKRITY